MSVDLSQFGFIPKQEPQQPQEEKGSVNLSEFGFIPKQQAQKKEEDAEETSFIRTLGNAILGTGSGLLGITGDIVSLTQSAADFAGDEISSFIKGTTRKEAKKSRQEMEDKQRDSFGGGVVDALSKIRPPTTNQVERAADFVTGGLFEPKTAIERGARTTGEFVGGSLLPTGAAGEGASVLSRLLKVPRAKELTGTIGAGVGTSLAEEGDLGLLGTLVAGGAGLAAGRGLANAGSVGKTAVTRGTQGVAARALGGTIDGEVLKSARELGIKLTPGALLDSRAAGFIEAKLAQSGLTGEKLNIRRKEVADSLAKAFKRDAEELSSKTFQNTNEALNEVQQGLKSSREFELKPIRQLYQTSKNAVPQGEKIFVPGLAEEVVKLRKELGNTLLKDQATDASKTRNVLEKLEKQLFETQKPSIVLDAKGNPVNPGGKKVQKAISVDDLVGTNVDLNDLINFEVQGGTQQLLKRIKGLVSEELSNYGKVNRKFGKSYSRANKEFADFAKTFRKNKDINRLILAENPGQIAGIGNNISSIQQLERALVNLPSSKGVPSGKDLFDKFKRFKLEEVLVNKVIDPITGNVSLKKQSTILNNPNSKALIKEIVGKENFERMQKLSKLSSKLDSKLTKFINGSNSATSIFDAGLSFSIGKDVMMGVATLNPVLAMKGVGKFIAPRLLGNLWADPAFIDEIIFMANQPVDKSFARSFAKASTRIAEEVKELEDDRKQK